MYQTIANPLTIPAGPTLDAIVAKQVMGWTELSILWQNVAGQKFYADLPSLGFPPGYREERKTIGGYWYWETNKAKPVPNYSTEIAAAWLVVEKYQQRLISSMMSIHPSRPPSALFVEILKPKRFPEFTTEKNLVVTGGTLCVFAETVPLAICRAVLLAATEEPRFGIKESVPMVEAEDLGEIIVVKETNADGNTVFREKRHD